MLQVEMDRAVRLFDCRQTDTVWSDLWQSGHAARWPIPRNSPLGRFARPVAPRGSRRAGLAAGGAARPVKRCGAPCHTLPHRLHHSRDLLDGAAGDGRARVNSEYYHDQRVAAMTSLYGKPL